MRTSTTATSGGRSSTARRKPGPSSASATTWWPASVTRRAMPARSRPESSAIATLRDSFRAATSPTVSPFPRHLRAHRGRAAGGALDRQAAVEDLRAVCEPREAGTVGVGSAVAVVRDLDHEEVLWMLPVPRVGASLSARPDAGFGGARVLGDVREGLGDHEVGGDLGRLGWPFVELHLHGGGHRGAPGERGDRRVEAPVGEDRGVDAPGWVPELGQGGAWPLGGLRQQAGSLRV